MNCKKGDIARYVAGPGHNPLNLDRLFEVLMAAGPGRWVVKPLGVAFNQFNAPLRCEAICDDCLLRPIRDPGDDAVDEMVELVGVPGVVVPA